MQKLPMTMQVRLPNDSEKQRTKWQAKHVFVEYFDTREIEALDKKAVKRWSCRAVPAHAEGQLGSALHLAQQAVNGGALV